VIPDNIELDTVEQWTEKLGAFATNTKILPILNMILTRRHLPGCFQYSNQFIAQQGNTLESIVKDLDAIPFRPLQQMFAHNEECDSCYHCDQSWRLMYPWTGLQNVTDTPNQTGCKRTVIPKGVIIYAVPASQWLFPTEDRYSNLIVSFADEIRVQVTGYSQLGRYHTFKEYKDYVRFLLFVKYLCSSGKFISMHYSQMDALDPFVEIMQSDNWKTTPALLWNERIANLDSRVAGGVSDRGSSLKIVTEKFKDQIAQCDTLAEFMETYFPKTNIITLAAMCRASEQPA
jgi:hypothetical protein